MFIEFRIFEEIKVTGSGKYSLLLEGEMGPHKAAHVHLREKGNRLASIRIDDGSVLAGEIPYHIRKAVLSWIELHRLDLLSDWKGMQKDKRPHTYNDFGM